MKGKEKVKNNDVLGCRLREARLAKGLTIQEVADQIGVSRQMISQYELGNSSPTPSNLLKLQYIYRMPMSFYSKPYYDSTTVRSQECFRSFKSATKSARDMAIQQSLWVTREIMPLIETYVKLPAVDPLFRKMKESLAIENRKDKNMETLSKVIRREWGLGVSPISNLVRLLEKRGVIVVILSLDQKLDAFSFWEKNRPYIFVSKFNSAVRMRMSIAHELCHLFFHETENYELDLKKLESEANFFASAFLLPQNGFESDIHSTALNQLLLLKPKWLVSVQAMIMRCEHLGIISEERTTYLWKQISRQRWSKKEPYDDEFEFEKPILLAQAIKLLISNKVKSISQLVSEFSLKNDFLEEVSCLDAGFFNEDDNLVRFDNSLQRSN